MPLAIRANELRKRYEGKPPVDAVRGLDLTLRVGEQISDIETGSRQSNATWGATATWQPTERTTLSLSADHQYYGSSHTLNFVHRMAHSIWSYTDTSGVSQPTPTGAQSPSSSPSARSCW